MVSVLTPAGVAVARDRRLHAALHRDRSASHTDSDAARLDFSAVATAGRRRPSTLHIGTVARLDAQGRVAARTVTDPLGWAVGDHLVARVTGPGAARIAPFDAADQHPFDQQVTVDATGRISVPATARAALDLRAGDQVLLIARPARADLQLRGAQMALAELTGCLELCEHEAAPTPAGPTRGIRAAWRPQAGPS